MAKEKHIRLHDLHNEEGNKYKERKYDKTYSSQKLMYANVNWIVLLSDLIDLDEVLHIHIFDEDRNRNGTRGCNTRIQR